MKNKTFGLVLMAGCMGLSQPGFTMRSGCVSTGLDNESPFHAKLEAVRQSVDQTLRNPILLEELLRIFTADTDQTAILHFGPQGKFLQLSAKERSFGRWPRAGAIAFYPQEERPALETYVRQRLSKDRPSLVESITFLFRSHRDVFVESSLDVRRTLSRDFQGNLIIEVLPELKYVCKTN